MQNYTYFKWTAHINGCWDAN